MGRELRWDLVVMGEVYRTGSNCGGYGLILGSGGDGRRVRFMWLFLKAWAMRKSVARVVLRHTIHRDA